MSHYPPSCFEHPLVVIVYFVWSCTNMQDSAWACCPHITSAQASDLHHVKGIAIFQSILFLINTRIILKIPNFTSFTKLTSFPRSLPCLQPQSCATTHLCSCTKCGLEILSMILVQSECTLWWNQLSCLWSRWSRQLCINAIQVYSLHKSELVLVCSVEFGFIEYSLLEKGIIKQ